MVTPMAEPRVLNPAAALVVVSAMFSAGCVTFSLSADRCPSVPSPMTAQGIAPAGGAAPAPRDVVKIQYLGVGGYLVRRGDDVVLFGPQYTNPSLLEVLFDHEIRTDQALVDRLLPSDAARARAIVIGHSHYDHLLDTPYIARTKAPEATVYGSATMVNLVGATIGTGRAVDVATAPQEEGWIKISERIRLRPIRSEHSSQVRLPITGSPLHLWRGTVAEPKLTLPATASGWAEGEVYAYLLDFLDQRQNVAFRIYYQDTGTSAPIGFPGTAAVTGSHSVRTLPGNVPIDVVLLAIAGDPGSQTGHPEALIAATKPRFVLLGHWEDFFVPQTEFDRIGEIKAPPRQDVGKVVRRARRAMRSTGVPGNPYLPCPTKSVFHIPVAAGSTGTQR